MSEYNAIRVLKFIFIVWSVFMLIAIIGWLVQDVLPNMPKPTLIY